MKQLEWAKAISADLLEETHNRFEGGQNLSIFIWDFPKEGKIYPCQFIAVCNKWAI